MSSHLLTRLCHWCFFEYVLICLIEQIWTRADLNIWLSAGSTSAKRWCTSLYGAEGPKGPAAHPVKLTSVALIFAAICWPVLKLMHQQCRRGHTRNPLWKCLWETVVYADFCCRIPNHRTLICVYCVCSAYIPLVLLSSFPILLAITVFLPHHI